MKVDELAEDNGEGVQTRPRTHELTSSLKVVPFIEHHILEWHDFNTELDAFLAINSDEVDKIARTPLQENITSFDTSKPQNTLSILRFLLEDPVENVMTEKSQKIVDSGVLGELNYNSLSASEVCLVFVLLITTKTTACRQLVKHNALYKVMQELSSFRFTEVSEIPELGIKISLVRAILHFELGGAEARRTAIEYQYKRYNLQPLSDDGASNVLTPTDYEAFRQSMCLRYPGFNGPRTDVPPSAQSVITPDNNRKLAPMFSSPDTPKSIEEACSLFSSKVRATPAFIQFWDQHEDYIRRSITNAPIQPEKPHKYTNKSLEATHILYVELLPYAKSLMTVVVNYILKKSMVGRERTGVHAALTMTNFLIEWFEADHVLERDFILTMLFDLQFHLVTYKYCARNPILDTMLQPNEKPVWPVRKHNNLLSPHSSSRGPKKHARTASSTNGVQIDQFNLHALEIYVLFARITRKIATGRPQRVLVLAELPAEPLKQLLSVYNEDLWSEVLALFKLQAPLNGKKWRCMNMEIISAIYLHCPAKLDDDWLTNGELLSEIKPPAVDEDVLRGIIANYNQQLDSSDPIANGSEYVV